MKHSPLSFERIFISCEAVMTNNEAATPVHLINSYEVVTQLIHSEDASSDGD